MLDDLCLSTPNNQGRVSVSNDTILGNVAHFLFRQKIEIQSRCALFHFLVYLVITLIRNYQVLNVFLRVLTLKISSTVPKKDEKKYPHLEVDHRFVKTTNLLSILVGILYYKQHLKIIQNTISFIFGINKK